MRFAGSGRIDLPGMPKTAVNLGIRPENIEIGAAGQGHIDAKVDVVERLGSDTYVYALVGDGTLVTIRRPGNARFAIGDTVGLGMLGRQRDARSRRECHLPRAHLNLLGVGNHFELLCVEAGGGQDDGNQYEKL